MFKREIENELKKWKKSLPSTRQAVVVKGLRQIGKTTSVLDFCRRNFPSVVHIDFRRSPDLKSIFAGGIDIDRITRSLGFQFPSVRFIPGQTVLVLDEIQDCSDARRAIRYFNEDGRYAIAATGSMLGLKGYNQKIVQKVPAGGEHIIEMQPMSFREFLWASGIGEDQIVYLRDCFVKREPVDETINDRLLELFKDYIRVGGMPKAIARYLETNDYWAAFDIDADLLKEYQDDFGQHLNDAEEIRQDPTLAARIQRVYDSLPWQLAKNNRKFFFNLVDKNAKQREYGFAITWLKDYGFLLPCYQIKRIEMPLKGHEVANSFKTYVADTGLLLAMFGRTGYQNAFANDNNVYRGALFENAIACIFAKSGSGLHYFDDGNEIDFVIEYQGIPALVEVKATNNKAKALKNVIKNKEKYHLDTAFKLIKGNVGKAGNVVTLPWYMAMFLPE